MRKIVTLWAVILSASFLMTANATNTVAAQTGATIPVNLTLPLVQPKFTDAQIINWTNKAAVAAFNYDYKNYQQALGTASRYYTKSGWGNFMTALKASGNLDAVVKNQLTVIGQTTGTVQVVKEGVENGLYTWNVTVPIMVSYINAAKKIEQKGNANMTIVRTADNGLEVGINQFILMPEKR